MQTLALFPERSTTSGDDSAFLKEFRGAALRWAMHAAAAGAILFSIFLLVAHYGERASEAAQLIRAFFVAYFAALFVLLRKRMLVNESNYVVVASLTSVISLVGTILILRVQFDDTDAAGVLRSTPAVVCGLFMMYAFLRLPAAVSLGIGVSVSAVAVLWAPVVSGGAETVRSAVYLTFTNVLGALIAGLIERRERELFYQKRSAEEAQRFALHRKVVAEEANQDKTRLVAAISHDLRQPMLAAVTHLDVLRHKLERADAQGAVTQAERARSAVDVLGSTLDHLLTAAHYDSGHHVLRIEEVGLARILREVLDLSIAEADRRGLEVRLRMPPHYVALMTDARSLRRVLDNLLSNAIKFSKVDASDACGAILLAARVRKDYCLISIVDRGPGIPADMLQEIWKPYVRIDGSERDRTRGLGLGLFLVKSIVEQLPGHSIAVVSRQGAGSRFTLRVPISDSRTPPTVSPTALKEPILENASELCGAMVVLVEDDRDARVAIIDLLEAYGVRVHASAVAEEVISAAEASSTRVNAIVCDYSLGAGRKGTDVIEELRRKLGYSPAAVLITGDSQAASVAAQAGPDVAVFKKPFAPNALLSVLVRAICAQKRVGPNYESAEP